MSMEENAGRASAQRQSSSSRAYLDRMIKVLRQSKALSLPGNELLQLDNVRPLADHEYLHAEAVAKNGGEATIAIAFGPEDGVIGSNYVFNAAMEAMQQGFGQLFLFGFAIQAKARELLEKMKIPTAYIAMTPDVVMSDLLKTTKNSDIFSITGLPDVRLEQAGKYFESDQAWLKRIRHEMGSGKGRSPHCLIFNDEAYHAYRRGDAASEESLDEDKNLASKNAREATIWIEGLDRINKPAGGSRRRGINLCADLSATPFYIQGSGNEVGKPFPWVVSDFGLLDAIESGLVKIPQLPARDVSSAEEAAYFNIWRWVQAKAKEDGLGTNITPEIVMNYASAPINLLALE